LQNAIGSKLRDAVEGLYDAFADYELPSHVAGCPHCVCERDDALIHSVSLRQLGPGELDRFAFKAMTTWGTSDTFRHFLPRLFELAAADGGGVWIDPEVLFGKFTYGGWTTWPETERRAVRLYLEALWQDVLGRFPHPFEIDSCLCCIGQAEDDLATFLDAWDVAGSAAAALHFAMFVEDNASRLSNKPSRTWRLGNPWWDGRPRPADQVSRWFLAPARVSELERAFFATAADDEATAESLSGALNHLCLIRNAAGVG
jgi:hypothetical protein